MKSDLTKQLVLIRRAIHRYPELGTEEFRTTALIEKTLRAARIRTKRITPTGLVAFIEGQGKGGTVALRGDIDALPITERTGKPYASRRPGVMHACGHDANCTMVLGAGLLLANRRSEFSGTVELIFQPNEESSGGASTMIAAGVLEKPPVDALVGIHVNPWLPVGVLGLKSGEMMAAVDRFTIDIIGVGGHGAYPHLTTDAVVVAAQAVTALQSIVSRRTDPVCPTVLTIGTINGGERFNIVCDRVTMVGTVRTLNPATRVAVKRMIDETLAGITAASGASYRLNYEALGNPLINHPEILAICRASGEAVLGKNRVCTIEKPSMGGEDFAEYLTERPGCFVYIGTGGKKNYPWHHEKFDIDESVLPDGAAFMADVALRCLKNVNTTKRR